MKLSDARKGTYSIKNVTCRRLVELGFVPGRTVEVQINRSRRLIVVIKGEKFAIDRRIAGGVEVD